MMTDTATDTATAVEEDLNATRTNPEDAIMELGGARNFLEYASMSLGRGSESAERLHRIRMDLAALTAFLHTGQGRSEVLTHTVEVPELSQAKAEL